MTITRERTDAGSTTAWPDVLLAVLDDVLLACAERDADLFSGRTPAGRALVELSALTRTGPADHRSAGRRRQRRGRGGAACAAAPRAAGGLTGFADRG
jgi:hypothetical protein